MDVIKVELPLGSKPEFYCPFSGHNLMGESFEDAIAEGHLFLSVNWEDPDEFVMGNEKLMDAYMNFDYDGNGDPTERVKCFLEEKGLSEESFIIELTVNAMACGPISETNTFVFYK